jgi:hypothetical protein
LHRRWSVGATVGVTLARGCSIESTRHDPFRLLVLSDMSSQTTVLERAFALARSGGCESVRAIRVQLKAEGFGLMQLEGRSLIKQLQAICMASRAASPS